MRVKGMKDKTSTPRALMETNVYSVKGRVLVAGSCLPEVEPEAFARLAAEATRSICCAWRRRTSTWR